MSKKWLLLGLFSFGVGFGVSLTLEKDIKRAATTGLIALPATASGVLVTEHLRKRQVGDKLSYLQQNVVELEKRTENLKLEEGNLQKSISAASESKKEIEVVLGNLQTEQNEFQNKVAVQRNQKQEFEKVFTNFESQKQRLETESSFLESRIEDLKKQETEAESLVIDVRNHYQNYQDDLSQLKAEFEELQQQEELLSQELLEKAAQKQLLYREISQFQQESEQLKDVSAEKERIQNYLNDLQSQISTQENYRSELINDINVLEASKSKLEVQIADLQNRIHLLESQLKSLNLEVEEVTTNYQQSQIDLSNLQSEFQQLQQQKEQLNKELLEKAAQKESLNRDISQLQQQSEQVEENKQDLVSDTSIELPTKLTPKVNEASSPYRLSNRRLGSGFRNSQYTKNIWEEQILPHWKHRNRPPGHRFLGSIRIKRQASEQILDIVGENLQQFDTITYDSLRKEFYELEQNWLKILTCAVSEYAYYYDDERFWQGFCERLNINHNSRVEVTLRKVVGEGIDKLGLIKANGGYRYISTLWLQSGVPEQNLGHFAQLVQDIANEYGWWEIAHSSDEDLSQVLLELCQQKHPHWGTLINFLKASYGSNKKAEPISGQLLQGIALIAQELERQNASVEILEDDNQREDLLGNYYLPQNFFLRDWSALIKVLTPNYGSGKNQNLIGRRVKNLSMSLDITDTLNTQLILPEQVLWKSEWRNLRGTYCQIPQAEWEDTIPREGDLIVPELVIEVNKAFEKWNCRLIDHNHQELMEWEYQGVNSNLPCLIFDAVTGEHIALNNQSPEIIGLDEIILFTPNNIQPEFKNEVEILDSYIPSSIVKWRGRLVRLRNSESSISLILENNQSRVINWKLLPDDEPVLTGLRLKGRKTIYLDAPAFWYPPIKQGLEVSLNLLIENLNERNIIARTIENLSANHNWSEISLGRWITEPGYYEARFWFEQKRWSYRFEVKSKYQVNQSKIQQPTISVSGYSEIDLPVTLNNSENFWSEVITIDGLWCLEEIIVILSNENQNTSLQLQANSSGALEIRLASLYDLLPESNWYALDYQRLGYEPQRIIQIESLVQNISWTWTKEEINITGLLPDKFYDLLCWNLLLPDNQPVKIKVPLLKEGDTTVNIPLNLPVGIYHIQLSEQQLTKYLGWWCGSDEYELPEAIEGDESGENYCYTILGKDESKEAVIEAVKKLSLDFDVKELQAGISSLETGQFYFPDWLDADSLLVKIKAILELINSESVIVENNSTELTVENKPSKQSLTQTVSINNGNWYLVTVQKYKREVFLKYIESVVKQKNLQNIIEKIEIPQDAVLDNIVLLNTTNYSSARTHLRRIEYFIDIQRRPLSLEQVNRMLGIR